MKTLGLLFCGGLCGFLAQGQGTFRNLDFELAQIPSNTGPGFIPATSALPFGTCYLGANQQSTVLYDGIYLDTAVIALEDTHSQFGAPIQGNYTPLLLAGLAGTAQVSASIAQTGVIPIGSKTLLFTANNLLQRNGWEVTIGGQKIPVTEVSQVSPNYFVYAGDISAFAGLSEELRFTALAGTGGSEMALDAIQFSPVALPEPRTLPILATGGLLSLLVFLRKQ